MTEIEAYQEYIRCKHNAFCKAVIRYAAIGKIIRLRQKWEREISLDYLTNEKFVQFAEPEPDEEHPFIVCGQTVLLCNVTLAAHRRPSKAVSLEKDLLLFSILFPAILPLAGCSSE